MRFTRTSKALGIMAIAAIALTGCGAGGGSNDGASQAAGDPEKIITAYSNEPQNPLLPANTNEVYGGRVVELLFEGLTLAERAGAPAPAATLEQITRDNRFLLQANGFFERFPFPVKV